MTHKGTADEGLLSIDLSSDRVRKALCSARRRAARGRASTRCSATSSKQGLHDLPARQVRATVPRPFSDRRQQAHARRAIRANRWRRRTWWTASRCAPPGTPANFPPGGTGAPGCPAAGRGSERRSSACSQIIDDYADALGDLSIAEAVFQIMRGNFGRAGGLMDAISRGERPPDPDVVDTPRGGLDLTHRVAAAVRRQSGVERRVERRHRSVRAPPPSRGSTPGLSTLLPDPAARALRRQLSRCRRRSRRHRAPVAISTSGRSIAWPWPTPPKCRSNPSWKRASCFAAALPADADQRADRLQPAAPPPGTISFPDFFFLAKSLRSADRRCARARAAGSDAAREEGRRTWAA